MPPEQYRQNLDQIIGRLAATGATVIWRNTTPVPEGGTDLRRFDDVGKYNAIAAEVMARRGVAVHDLYTFAKEREQQIQRPNNVHYTPEGSDVLAGEVARVIREALAKR